MQEFLMKDKLQGLKRSGSKPKSKKSMENKDIFLTHCVYLAAANELSKL